MNVDFEEYVRLQRAIYQPKVDKIIEVVSDHTQVSRKAIIGHKRFGDIAKARRYVQFLCRENLPCTLSVIGYLTGNGKAWNHSTVLHNINKIKGEITVKHRDGRLIYPEVKEEIDELRCKVKTAFLK